MTIGIYKITNTINGKIYIGSSKNIEKRWDQHKNKLNFNKHCNPHLQYSWNKYGKEYFIFEIIKITSEELRLTEEQYYLDTLTPFVDSIGMNISKFAGGGDTISNHPNKTQILEKMKKSMNHFRDSLSEDEKKELFTSKGNLGHKWSDEMKENARIKHLGQKRTVEQNIKTSNTLKEGYQSGRIKSQKGRDGWKHTSDSKNKIGKANSKKISIDNKEYESITEASNILKISYNFIHWRLNNEKFPNYFYITKPQ